MCQLFQLRHLALEPGQNENLESGLDSFIAEAMSECQT